MCETQRDAGSVVCEDPQSRQLLGRQRRSDVFGPSSPQNLPKRYMLPRTFYVDVHYKESTKEGHEVCCPFSLHSSKIYRSSTAPHVGNNADVNATRVWTCGLHPRFRSLVCGYYYCPNNAPRGSVDRIFHVDIYVWIWV